MKPRNKERNLIRKLDAGVTMVLFTTKNDKTYNSEAFEKSDPDLVIMTGTGAFTSGDVSGDYTFIYGEHKDEIKSITKEELAINIYNYLENKIRRNQKWILKFKCIVYNFGNFIRPNILRCMPCTINNI